MKEIGGYFELEELVNRPYYQDVLELNSARNALSVLLKARSVRKLYLPYLICESVWQVCRVNQVEVSFYHINEDLLPVCDLALGSDEALYFVNYYGMHSNRLVEELKKRYANLMVDQVQAFFQEPVYGVDTIYSCRKFFGVPDGAYLYSDCKADWLIETGRSADRMSHLLGRYEGRADRYYEAYRLSNDSLGKEEPRRMSLLTRNLLGAIDYRAVAEKRDRNYQFLRERLRKQNRWEPAELKGAFAYPLYKKDGIGIRKKLAQKGIYIPTLWPNVLRDLPKSSLEYEYAANLLPVPCDQRYGTEDMLYVCQCMEEVL